MARPMTTLAVFFIAFNVFAAALSATGVAAVIGVDSQVGGDDAVDQTQQEAEKVKTGNGLGDTLFDMYNVVSKGLSKLFGVIFPGLNMMERAGVPGYITKTILAPLFSLVVATGIISFLKGYDL